MSDEALAIGWPRTSVLVHRELNYQAEKWGPQRNHYPSTWFVIATEEYGEIAKALLDNDLNGAKYEIVQTIACLAQLFNAIQDLEEKAPYGVANLIQFSPKAKEPQVAGN